jgi:GT2 family glycosyltransferase
MSKPFSPENPLVFIIILSWNHWEITADCLRSLERLTYPNHRILLVDNGSTDGTVESLPKEFPNVILLANRQNLGFAPGCNVGIKYALTQRADFVLLLNNDTVVPEDLIDVLVNRAKILPDAGVLAPMLRYHDRSGRIWFAGSRRHWLTLESVDSGPEIPRRHTRTDELHTVDYIFGTAMMIPTAVLQKVGLFDEHFFMYYEDLDFCLRIQEAGYQLYYVPDTTVEHRVSSSTQSLSTFRYYHKARSSVYFFRKHAYGLRRLIIPFYRLGSALRTVLRLASRRQWPEIRAYLRGLKDGLSLANSEAV